MHSTVLIIVAVLLLHGVSGHLFQRVLPHKLTKQLPKYHTRHSNADVYVDKSIDKRLKEDVLDGTFPPKCLELTDVDDDDDDPTQEEFNALYSVFCRPECGNLYLSVLDEYGYFYQPRILSRDFFIGLCGTNENGDKCYESYVDTLNKTLRSELFCYSDDEQCNCRSTLLAEVKEKGCCLDIYQYIDVYFDDEFKPSDLYDACNVDFPSGCNNSPISSGFMPQVALVTLISALIFSVVFR